jgi:hypothetical protein
MQDTIEFPPIDADMIDSATITTAELDAAYATLQPATEVVDRAEIHDGKPLVTYSATEAGLAALRRELAGKTYDLKTTKGDQEARADRLRCVTLRTTLEKKRKQFKEPALEFGKLIDAEAKRITTEIEKLEAPIDAAIKADEQRRAAEKAERERIEAARVQRQRDRIATIRGYVAKAAGLPSDRIAAGLEFLRTITIGDDYEEFAGEAEAAKQDVLAELQAMLTAARQKEADDAERERQRLENERVAAELAEQRRALEAEAARLAEEAAALRRQAEAAAALAAKQEAERAAAEAKAREDAGVKAMLDAMTAATAPVVAPEATMTIDPAPLTVTMNGESATLTPLLSLGKMADRMGFTLGGAFISELGIEPYKTDKRASLYTEAQYRAILRALIDHLKTLEAA